MSLVLLKHSLHQCFSTIFALPPTIPTQYNPTIPSKTRTNQM